MTNNANALHVVASIVVDLVDHTGGQVGFALSCTHVELFAGFNDLVFIFLVVAIVVVVIVILVVVVVVFSFHTAHALFVDNGFRRVGKGEPGKAFEGDAFRKGSAGVIGKETQMNGSSLVGAVGSNKVLDFFFLVKTTVVVVVVVILVVVNVELLALHVLFNVELFNFVFLVGVLVDALFHSRIDEAVVLAVVAVKVIILILVVAVAHVVELVFTLVLQVRALGFEPGFHEGVHVDNVVTVSAGAASRLGGRARLCGAQTEADETLGLDFDVFFTVGFVVPLLDVMAALELDGVSRDPIGAFFKLFFLSVVLFELTSLGHQVLTKNAVGVDFRHGRSHGEQGREGEKELHLW